MKSNFSRLVVSVLLCIPLYSLAEEKTAATPDTAPTQAQMQAMQQQMQTMQTQMNADDEGQNARRASIGHAGTLGNHAGTYEVDGSDGLLRAGWHDG